MKKTAIMILIAICLVASSAPAFGEDRDIQVTADVVLVRPLSLAATVVGTALFIVALPFSIPSGSVKSTAETLIAEPFKYTFTRPVGWYSEKDGPIVKGKQE